VSISFALSTMPPKLSQPPTGLSLPDTPPLSTTPHLGAPITDARIDALLSADRSQVMRLVTEAYRLYAQGLAVEETPSYLRPPHDARARIIAKPACLYGDQPVAGIKWVGSFPGNLSLGLPRASGLLVLNDMRTGLPIGSLEVAAINAHRTSASAVVALNQLHGRPSGGQAIALIGTGHIGWQMACYLVHEGWVPEAWVLHDLDVARAQAFAHRLATLTPQVPVRQASSAAAAVQAAEVVVFTTTAGVPHLNELTLRAEQTLLHISLRDLGVAVMASAHNFVDVAELAFSHQTSLHLAEQALGHRGCLSGEIGRVLQGGRPDGGKPVIFSPFGMAILDLAVGQWVVQQG
jgi:2,3-diaminopropionate biosynthesis protein SbnB